MEIAGNTNTEIQNFERVYINFTPSIPPLKKVKDKTTINVRYCVIEPFAYIHIYWDPKISEVIYKIEEPVLSREESKYLEQLLLAMRSLINYDSVVENDQESLLDHIDKRLKFLAVELGMTMDYESYKKIYYYLCRDFIGFNEIEPLLRDYFVEDIECNGGTTPVYLVHRVFRNLKTTLVYKDLDKLGGFVEKLAQRCGKYISYADPILDGSLPDGSRVNATYTEDTRELNLPRENWLPSVSRGATGAKKIGEVDLFTLLKGSFRQNPDYVIVGEVRGKEAYVLFQGMASGHSSISTIHADSVHAVIRRLETPPIELSPSLLNVLDCVCIMTHAIVNNQFYFKRDSKILTKIAQRHGLNFEEIDLEFKRRVKLIYQLYKNKITGFEEVQKAVNDYYKHPKEILEKFGIE